MTVRKGKPVTTIGWLLNECRLHGPSCRIPWGYDSEHTDSPHPYTLAELVERAEAPHRYAYASVRDYEQGFSLWRALRRDEELSAAEREARMIATFERRGLKATTLDEAVKEIIEGRIDRTKEGAA